MHECRESRSAAPVELIKSPNLFGTNSYLLNLGKATILVDPVSEPIPELKLERILLTHAHFDHFVTADAWRESSGALLYAHPDAKSRMTDAEANAGRSFGISVQQRAPEEIIQDGDILELGEWAIEVIGCPGHAPDCLSYLGSESGAARFLITGDFIFQGDIGRCDLDGSSYETMLESLRKLKARGKDWPSDLPLYPGHGPSTTWGAELSQNSYLKLA